MPSAAFLPYGRQSIDEDDIAAVSNVLRSDWLTGGPAVAQFEQAFARTVGAPHAIACSNGTTALHLAALALDLGPGDAVVVPAITFLASATAFRVQGATIVFADVDPQTGLMTAETCEAAIGREGHNRVRAVVPVHLGGRCSSPADMAAVARRHGAAVVEDACHALGTVYESGAAGKQSAGACADAEMAIFSLHPVKSATMGEGGVVTTRDPAIAARVARLRNHGMERSPDAFVDKELGFDKHGAANPWYYEIHELALNYRASDINCALGTSQLAKFPRFAARRRQLASRYDAALPRLAPMVRPNAAVPGCDPVLHLYSARIDFAAAGVSRAETMTQLKARGIGTQVHYIPVHLQPFYRKLSPGLSLPGADAYYASTLSLPLFPAMADADVDRVVDALAEVLGLR